MVTPSPPALRPPARPLLPLRTGIVLPRGYLASLPAPRRTRQRDGAWHLPQEEPGIVKRTVEGALALGVTDEASLVDILAGEAEVGGGRLSVPVRNARQVVPDLGYFAPFLRRVILVSEAALRGGLGNLDRVAVKPPHQ